jgi:hypothetical protein
VTGIASVAVIAVTADASVLGVHPGLRVLVTVEAAEDLVVSGYVVARVATAPFARVNPGVHREELVVLKCGTEPCLLGVAIQAGGRKSASTMLTVVVILVAGDTVILTRRWWEEQTVGRGVMAGRAGDGCVGT